MIKFLLCLSLLGALSLGAESIVIPARSAGMPVAGMGDGIQIDYPFRGFSDAMADEAQFQELSGVIRALGIHYLRFPGGMSAHAYSPDPDSFEHFEPYAWSCSSKVGRWVDYRQFFRFCKENAITAIYQLNITACYDHKRQKVFFFAPNDARDTLAKRDYDETLFAQALAEAAEIVRTARSMGVKVLWEFGNEDFVYYSPETYVKVVTAFQKVVKENYPNPEFVVCGDGWSWSDWSWPEAVFALFKYHKLQVDYAALHVYVAGGGGKGFDRGETLMAGILEAWSHIRNLHQGSIMQYLRNIGLNAVKPAIDEGNIDVPNGMVTGKPLEHGIGRGLGEAAIYPERISKFALLIHHDLVRSDDQSTWFCRIFYHPGKPLGQHYELPVAAQIMAAMARHQGRTFVFDDRQGIAVSEEAPNLYVTMGNIGDSPRTLQFQLKTAVKPGEYSAEVISAADYGATTAQNSRLAVRASAGGFAITLPPRSFAALRLPK